MNPPSYYTAASIIIHMDLDLVYVGRSVFTFWEALGEIGGLYSLLYGFFLFLSQIFSYNKSGNLMASKLYTDGEK